jgi:hypothetical protein
MRYCRICGNERTAEFRARSGMVLCESCHRDTPSKATFAEFCAIVTGEDVTISRDVLREFFSDYKTSTFGDVRAYWRSCSATDAELGL